MSTTAEISIPQTESTNGIEVRRMDFSFDQVDTMDWYRDNPILTAFIGVLSGTFPSGEQMFIESVRNYKDRVTDPQLLENVKDFTRQEAHHTNQHKLANEKLESLGWKAQNIEKRVFAIFTFFLILSELFFFEKEL